MDIVKARPKLSPFQQVLLDCVSQGLIAEEGLERIRSEGTVLVLRTVERFMFRFSSLQGSYERAVRMVEVILTLGFVEIPHEERSRYLATKGLNDVFRVGLGWLKELDELEEWYSLSCIPLVKRSPEFGNCFEQLAEKVAKSDFNKLNVVAGIINEKQTCKKNRRVIELAEVFVRQVGGKMSFEKLQYEDMQELYGDVAVPAQSIINSHLFSLVCNTGVGYELTPEAVRKAVRRGCLDRGKVLAQLSDCRRQVPQPLVSEYDELVGQFVNLLSYMNFFDCSASNKNRSEAFRSNHTMFHFSRYFD